MVSRLVTCAVTAILFTASAQAGDFTEGHTDKLKNVSVFDTTAEKPDGSLRGILTKLFGVVTPVYRN